MDPPSSPSFSHPKDNPNQLQNNERAQHQEKPRTPKTANTNESHPSHSPPAKNVVASGPRQLYDDAIPTEFTPRPPSPPLHRSRNAAKIIKGEIHNVLSVMRSDPRYYSTGGGGGGGA
eukprot:CAMPEP_0172560212 /NCGR_PEP_ID=MMETSP1067-20121228/87578_1 /TAXON_ID=265564 ORGANISM="Thalassiosira punctigera, Strain Tpunct2005C2" /NCGR_SAMPLE_ID=MMETSP1067 /ASSEMBLY_ACC=CAM_ASM_000444 /LENGTH=117 /DNA_ID=CAMNT_0013349959 /DNA_START=15 /DNA_END=365 /DNA_ORIENTATION=-